jgi:hypothetical protein
MNKFPNLFVEERAAGGAAEVPTGEICVNFVEATCIFISEPIDYNKYEGFYFEAFKEYAHRI